MDVDRVEKTHRMKHRALRRERGKEGNGNREVEQKSKNGKKNMDSKQSNGNKSNPI